MTKSKVSFNEFSAISAKAWKQKIQADLKGLDYNDTLLWTSNEGIAVKPFYNAEDNAISNITYPEKWQIGEVIFINNAENAGKRALEYFSKGSEAICFKAHTVFNIQKLFEIIKGRAFPIFFEFNFLEEEFIQKVHETFKNYQAPFFVATDIIKQLTTDGNWFYNLNEDHNIFTNTVTGFNNTLSVDSRVYKNAGANIVQELAYTLAHCNEYLNHLFQKELPLKDKSITLTLHLSIGENYFFEIAKFRALRVLLDTLLAEYTFIENYHITATPATRNKTIYDYNNNMLRTTTEYMSAILGGVNTVFSQPYDVLYHKTNDFGQRIARNQMLLLREESYFSTVTNAADGSYYIESLTKQFTNKALNLFKDIEANGGFVSQLIKGTIQKKIKESAAQEQQQFDNNQKILVGTNKFVNALDQMKENLELYPFIKRNPRKTLIEPIIPVRLAEKIEQKRLTQEEHN